MINLLVTHTDVDGLGSLILAKFFDLPFDRFVCYDYGFETDKENIRILYEADCIVVADLTLPKEIHEDLLKKGKQVQVFDHHKTSDWLVEMPGCVWDTERCGTKLFFEEYVLPKVKRFPIAVKEFVDLVDVYDRWVLDSPLRPASEDLQRVFVRLGDWNNPNTIMRHDRFITRVLRKFIKDASFKWDNVELVCIQKAKDAETAAYQSAVQTLQIRTDRHGHKFGVFSAWGKISMTSSRLLNEDNIDVDYLVCAQTFQNKLGKVSFRSREGKFDLLDLAGVFGHTSSAGASLCSESVKKLLKNNLCFEYKADADPRYSGEPLLISCKN